MFENIKDVPLSVLYEAWKSGKHARLTEAIDTSQFPVLLKDGLKMLLFSEFAGVPTEWDRLATVEPSNKQFETYIRTGGVGTLPKVDEGNQYQRAGAPDLRVPLTVQNFKYGFILEITDEMLRFDRYGVIRGLVADLARAAAQTKEEAVFIELTTTAKYDGTTADSIAANNSTNGLSPANLITAYNVLVQMKDRASGRPLGVMPDTLIVTPDMGFFANQLFLSPTIGRVGPAGSTDVAANIYGQGERNPFFGLVRNVIVSNWLRIKGGQYHWILCQAKRGLVVQQVDPLQLMEATEQAQNESYFEKDVFRYRVREWFGVGLVDSRYWYYANSTTAPAVG